MTSSPPNLLAVRSMLQPRLRLPAVALGITGDPNHRGGYHCGADRVVTRDYSVIESPRDTAGLSDYAAALDIGKFELRAGGKTHTLRDFSTWCVAQCKANTPDSRDIREIIYSPDGVNVRRWDRLGKRTTGDSSHLSHTHISFFRDAIKAGRDQRPLFARYLTQTELLETDMAGEYADAALKTLDGRNALGEVYLRLLEGRSDASTQYSNPWSLKAAHAKIDMLTAQLAALAGKDLVDEQQIITGLLAVLTPQAIADAIPARLAQQVADELGRRIAPPPGS